MINDVIHGFTHTPEYQMTFIPPTKAEIRAQKWAEFKSEFYDYLYHLGLWLAAGIFIHLIR